MARRPLSDRLCDGVCLAGALWTLACHFTIVTSGNLYALLIAAMVLGIGGTIEWIVLDRRGAEKTSTDGAIPSGAPDQGNQDVTTRMRIAASLAGAVIAATYALTADIRQAWWLLVPWLLFALWQHWSSYDRPMEAVASRTTEAVLWLLAMATVGVTLVAHRPNIDDSYYLSLATGAADHPQKSIYGFDPMFGTESSAMRPPYYRVLSMELLAASVSWLTSVPVIFLMHIVFASFAALLIPLAAARLLRLLSPGYWLWCTVALMAVLLMDGDAPTSYGNMSLVRMQQGKSMMLMVALPLTVAYSLELMRRGTTKSWLLLAASVVFGLGCSPTAMILLPAVSGFTMLAIWRPTRASTVRLTAGMATSIYPIAVVLILLALASQLPGGGRQLAGRCRSGDKLCLFDELYVPPGVWNQLVGDVRVVADRRRLGLLRNSGCPAGGDCIVVGLFAGFLQSLDVDGGRRTSFVDRNILACGCGSSRCPRCWPCS